MKIGILTYHRAENYGALLQAYALMTYLRSLGHEVSFVDYWPKYHSDYFKTFSWRRFLKRGLTGRILMILNFLMPTMHIRKRRLQRFMRDKLELCPNPKYSDMDDTTEHYDVVIYGSDQIWRKQYLDGVGFDKWYFGSDNVQAERKVVYAGSMGTINTTQTDDDFFKSMLPNFDIISVRENNFKKYLNSLNIECVQVIDPVFLLSKEQWKSIKSTLEQRKDYILFYNLLDSAEGRRFADKLGKEKGIPVIEINKKTMMGKGYVRNASVERFLQLIDGAAYVVSNSFHGVAFSIIFEKQFFAVDMGNRANRVKSLLESAGLISRYYEKTLDSITTEIISYERINNNLKEEIEKSKMFLKTI